MKRLQSRDFALLSAVSALALMTAGGAYAQDAAQPAADADTVVIVTGIRASNKRSVDIKKNANQIVDAISAQDIGKLPDATISDSLERIPGIQVVRSAGEAGQVNIRGLGQVATFLNGEDYIGANSITSVQPNYGDIPSQLMSGAEVYKSATANQLGAGITGTINLKTWTPFDLKKGFTLSAAAEDVNGDVTRKNDVSANALAAWRNSDYGFLFSISHSDTTAYNGYNGMNGNTGWSGKAGENWAFTQEDYNPAAGWNQSAVTGGLSTYGTPIYSGGALQGYDQNGNGSANDEYVAYEGWYAANQTVERQRDGFNLAYEAHLNDSYTLSASWFHTKQAEWDNSVGFVAENKWASWGWFQPTQMSLEDPGENLYTVQSGVYNAQRISGYTQVSRYDSKSDHYDLKLSYDHGGPFRYTARLVFNAAAQHDQNIYIDSTLANQRQWGAGLAYGPNALTAPVATNPNGYADLYPIAVNNPGGGTAINIQGVSSALAGDVGNYAVDAISSEGNYDRSANELVGRLDGHYDGSGHLNFDFGARYSQRLISNQAYDNLSPLYADYASSGTQNLGQGCLVKWKSSDVILNQASACTVAAAGTSNFFTALQPTTLSSMPYISVSSFGGATGLPAMYAADPEALSNPEAFLESQYPGTVRWDQTGASYLVKIKQAAAYVQGNFEGVAVFPYKGNAGFQYVSTEVDTTQEIASPVGGQYGASNPLAGYALTKNRFNYFLPSLNVAFDLASDVKLRFAASRNMQMLDAANWGGGKSLTYAHDLYGAFTVQGGSESGNPNLKPWVSKNLDLSLEWYNAPQSMFSADLFWVNVERFVTSGYIQSDEADQTCLPTNAPCHRVVTLSTLVQGSGGQLSGLELATKQAFTYLPGIWSNFGVDANVTYSPSTLPRALGGGKDLSGDRVPFTGNSLWQTNLVLWYQKDGLQFRIADNYRSRRLVSTNLLWGTQGLEEWMAPTNYVDASISYDFTKTISGYINASNITKEKETDYMQWTNQQAYQNQFERRISIGIRAKY